MPVTPPSILRNPDYREGWSVDCRRTEYTVTGPGAGRYRLPCLVSTDGDLLGPALEEGDKPGQTWWIVPESEIELPLLVTGRGAAARAQRLHAAERADLLDSSPRQPAAMDAARLLADLVAIDSVNPALVPGAAGESEIAAYVAAWLREHGLDVTVLDEPRGRPSVVAVARGSGGGASLMLNAHTDTVGVAGMTAPTSRTCARGASTGAAPTT